MGTGRLLLFCDFDDVSGWGGGYLRLDLGGVLTAWLWFYSTVNVLVARIIEIEIDI